MEANSMKISNNGKEADFILIAVEGPYGCCVGARV